MKIIFLDIDGVLNHELWFKIRKSKLDDITNKIEYKLSYFDPRCVNLLNELVLSTNAKIVISSSWRKNHTLEEMQYLFKQLNFKGEIIDMTPVLSYANYNKSVPRGSEIKAWLETNKGILNNKISKVPYVIFDDDSDMLYWQREKYIKVDSYCGLTPNIIFKAKQILNYK